MPSTNVTVGLLEGRISSRVLKPPGGGHSDLFGRDAPAAEQYARNKHLSQLSGIQACLCSSDGDNSANGKDNDANGATGTVGSNGQEQEVVDSVVEEVKKDVAPVAAAAAVPAPQKVRVPPGGFSSGFW